MQKCVSKFRLAALFGPVFSISIFATSNPTLQRADSLYNQKKLSEASNLYWELYQQGYSSPVTLLKMAQVHEGLDHIGKALFFLNSYFYKTEDQKAYDKIQVLANARNLSGYELSDFDRVIIWATNRDEIIDTVLFGLCVASLSMMALFFRRGNYTGKITSAIFCLLFAALFFLANNFITYPSKAVATSSAYLMDGPSAGANLIEIIPEGNSVSVSDEQDVWIKAEWDGTEGYIRKSDLLRDISNNGQ